MAGIYEAMASEQVPAPPGGGGRLVATLALVLAAPVALFAAMVLVDRTLGPNHDRGDYVVRLEIPPSPTALVLPPVAGPEDSSRPLVVIDPGHGGHDPGAGSGQPLEKDLTLQLARALRARLLAGGGIRVALTRDDDRYLLLEERSGIARALKADLFVSIHADSADAPDARGGTVYTLSSRGSSDEASRIAARENGADSVNGVLLTGANADVNAILVDLSQRRSEALSDEFAHLILREGQGQLAFRDRALQSAAFVVLKAPDLPSVLFEAGYITNPDDLRRLTSPEGSDAFAEVTSRAIRVFFARHSQAAGGPATTSPASAPASQGTASGL